VDEMTDIGFKRMIFKKISEFQGNTEKQLNKLRKTILGMNEKFNKDFEKEPNKYGK
jgi:hypothetical protein